MRRSELPTELHVTQEDLSQSKPNWRDLAAEAAKEKDPQRLTKLIEDLCRAFDEEHKDGKDAK